MNAFSMAEPCHNFCILSQTVIPCDPLDQREKFVFVTYVAAGTGRLCLVDSETMQSEIYDLPNDEGAWGLLWLEDRGELIIGTCSFYGSLHCFDMKTRTFAPPLRLETETYLWDLARGKDGCVYASTYPGCIIAKYDPEKRTLTNAGMVGTNPKNQYSRYVMPNADGNILASAGHAQVQGYLYKVDTKEFIQLGEDGDKVKKGGEDFICLENGKILKFLDAFTLDLIGEPVDTDHPETFGAFPRESVRRYLASLVAPSMPYLRKGITGCGLKSGARIGIYGQDLYRYENGQTHFIRIPCEAPATAVMTIVAVGDEIWGSCEFGQTIFHYDPETGSYENTSQVAAAGGEVYGMVPLNGKLYLTSYIGGDHVVYDPKQPWNQYDNINPRLLGSVAPEMVRPHAKSVVGPDGNIWTGWYASYGVYGGGLSRINLPDETVDSWFGLIPEQAIEHLVAGKDALYAVTSGEASGLSYKADGYHLLKIDTNGQVAWKRQFEEGIFFRRMAVADGRIYVSVLDQNTKESRVHIFDESTMAELTPIKIGTVEQYITDLLIRGDDLFVFTKGEALRLTIPFGRIIDRCPIPGVTNTTTVDENGTVYFAVGKTVYRLDMEP